MSSSFYSRGFARYFAASVMARRERPSSTSKPDEVLQGVRLEMIKKYVQLKRKPMVVTGVKVFIAAGIACMIPRGIFWFFPANNYLIITVSAIIGAFTYLFLAKIIFHVNEISELMLFLRRKLKRRNW